MSQQPAAAPIYIKPGHPPKPGNHPLPVPPLFPRRRDTYRFRCVRRLFNVQIFQKRTGRYSTTVVDWVVFIERPKMAAM